MTNNLDVSSVNGVGSKVWKRLNSNFYDNKILQCYNEKIYIKEHKPRTITIKERRSNENIYDMRREKLTS